MAHGFTHLDALPLCLGHNSCRHPALARRTSRAMPTTVIPRTSYPATTSSTASASPPPRPHPARARAPLTDAEWDALAPILAAQGCGLAATRRAGRPAENPRARLDAIFRAVTLRHPDGGRAPWRMLPEAFGKPDTASRTHPPLGQGRPLGPRPGGTRPP